MIALRPSEERGGARLDWLDSRHTFSFADYHDARHMGFRALRVINEDRVKPGFGFDLHPHRDVEVVTCVLEGQLEHGDSLGKKALLNPGDAQLVSAGTGIWHSEANPSPDREVHFLQIWILPDRKGGRPRHDQAAFPPDSMKNRFATLASADGREGSLSLAADAAILGARLDAGRELSFTPAPGRHAWVQVVSGRLGLLGASLGAGDGAAVSGETRLDFKAPEDAHFLLFDLA